MSLIWSEKPGADYPKFCKMYYARLILLICLLTQIQAYGQLSNDDCNHAFVLTAGTNCILQSFTNLDASAEGETVAPEPSCGSYLGADVWFKVVMPLTGGLRIEVDNNETAVPPSFTVYSGDCGNFTEIACARNDKGKTVYDPTLAGSWVYIRAYRYFSTSLINFSICAYEPQIPENDLCANAISLQAGGSCEVGIFSSVFSTSEGSDVAPDPSCGTYYGGDVWFKTVMPPSGELRIEKSRVSGAAPPQLTVYTGTCGSFSEVHCNTIESLTTIDNTSLIGETLYLRLYSYTSEEGQRFSLCLYEEPAPRNDDCHDALPITVSASCEYRRYSNFLATSEGTDVAADPSCGAYAGADLWFTFTMPASGALSIDFGDWEGPAPPSYALYSGSCKGFTELACENINARKTIYLPALGGETLFLRTYTYESSTGYSFDLCLSEPVIPDNDDCASALLLVAGESCVMEDFDNVHATAEGTGVAAEPSCGQYGGGDVWFKVVVPESGKLFITRKRVSGAAHPMLSAYAGTCGNFVELLCNASDTSVAINDQELAGEMLYLRLNTIGSEDGQVFSLCLYDIPCAPATVDAGEVEICQGESYVFGSQVIEQEGEYTEVLKTKAGCDSLVVIKVIVRPAYSDVDGGQVNICQGEAHVFGSLVIEEAGEYTEVFKTRSGCDSVVTINVTVRPADPPVHGGEVSICDGDTYVFGSQMISEAGEYMEVFTSNAGCDSVVTISVAIHTVNTAVEQTGAVLRAQAEGASYQWLSCRNGYRPIQGATKEKFVPTVFGEYAVVVTDNVCSDTSACYGMNVVNVIDEHFPGFRLFPNPVADRLQAELSLPFHTGSIQILDLRGDVLKFVSLRGEPFVTIEMEDLIRGVYLVKIQADSVLFWRRIIKR